MIGSLSELALALPPQRPGHSRAEEVHALLSEVTSLVKDFISLADADANALPTGHGLQIPGGGPRTVLVERHPPQKLCSLLDLSVDGPGIVGKNQQDSGDERSPSNATAENAKDFRNVAKSIMDLSVNTSSPGFMDKLYSSPSPPALAGDLLLSTLNTATHVYSCSPALTVIEKFVGVQLATLFGLPGRDGDDGKTISSSNVGGVTMPGGAASNTNAMLIARNVRFPQIKESGLSALPGSLAIFTSASAHYSAVTAAQTLGLGSKSVKKVKTLPDDSIDPKALEAAMEAAVSAGEIPFFVLGTAGTTVRGAYDDLTIMGQLARKYGAWFHVDACWGGGAVFSPKLRHKLRGSELADSVAFNPHKMIGVVQTCSFLLGRDLRTFWAANRLEAGYLFHGDSEEADVNGVDASVDGRIQADRKAEPTKDTNIDWRNSPWVKAAPNADTVFDLAQFTPQCGRRTEALKVYMHWKYYGTEGIARHVESSFAGARRVMELVAKSPVLKAVAAGEPPCAQACFYYSGEKGSIDIQKRVTREIVARLANRGWMTDFAPGQSKDEEYIRAVCNRLTTGPVAEGLVKAAEEIGREVEKEFAL